MNFGHAIEALKEGCKVAREGWNGQGMFLFLLPAGTATQTSEKPTSRRGADKSTCSQPDFPAAYAALIDKINGRGTWDSNPFVWVYEYELCEKPE